MALFCEAALHSGLRASSSTASLWGLKSCLWAKSCVLLPLLSLGFPVYTTGRTAPDSLACEGLVTFGSVQFSLSVVSDSVTPWTAARQESLSITNSRSSLKLMSIESVMPSSHLILCRPLLLPPSIFPSIRVFSNESVLRIKVSSDSSRHRLTDGHELAVQRGL